MMYLIQGYTMVFRYFLSKAFFAVAIFPPAFKITVMQIPLQQLYRSFKLLLVNHLPAYPQEPLKR